MKSSHLLIILALCACHNRTNKSPKNVKDSVAGLATVEQKQHFLHEIRHLDQELRGDSVSSILLRYGRDSRQYQTLRTRMKERDSFNLHLIEIYLEMHGYPDATEFDDITRDVPILVIHHSSDMQTRRRHFAILRKAYQDGDIDITAFNMYLDRTYHIQFGHRLQMESPFTAEDEMREKIQQLALE